MIRLQLNGGLGNQLFQYAAGKSLALHHNVPLLLDISSFHRKNLPELEVPRDFELYNFEGIGDNVFRLSDRENEEIVAFLKKKSLAKLLPNHRRSIYTEPFYRFDANFFNSRNNVLLRGQWQSEKYFVRYTDFFRQTLTLNPTLIAGCLSKAKEVNAVNSVAVHVRRADYLRKQIILEWHGVMDKAYYSKAFKKLDEALTDYSVFYFTDDPAWVQQELFPLKEGELISGTTSSHYEDFHLMQNCRHNVIANSSFSWWAAWLNSHPGKIVMAPERWFNHGPKDTQDLLPESWIRL